MPTISRFFGITITMYFDDHDPPHFHARHATGEAKVEIESLEVMDSTRWSGGSSIRAGLGRTASGRVAGQLAESASR